MKRSSPLLFAALTLAAAGTLAAAWRQPAGSRPVEPEAVPSPRVLQDGDVRLAQGRGPEAVPGRQEATASNRTSENLAAAEVVRQRAAGLGQELDLPPSEMAFLAELLLAEEAQRAWLVAEWRRNGQSEAASTALRTGLDDLARGRADALQGRLSTSVAEALVRRLGQRTAPPGRQREAGRRPTGTDRTPR